MAHRQPAVTQGTTPGIKRSLSVGGQDFIAGLMIFDIFAKAPALGVV